MTIQESAGNPSATFEIVGPAPEIPQPNPMPLDWHTEIPRMRDLFVKASAQSYDLCQGINWETLKADDYSPDERVALAYWLTSCATFEQSGVGGFALALISAYENHAGHDVAEMLTALSRDEVNHDEMCRRAVEQLIPGFPHNVADRSPFGSSLDAAIANLKWISQINSKYWVAFKRAFETRRLPAMVVPFIVGEASSSLIFANAGQRGQHPVFRDIFGNIAKDEGRHFGFCNLMAEKWLGTFTDEECRNLTKGIRASFIYISVVMDVPRKPFWDVPAEFLRTHDRLSALNTGLLGMAPLEERQDMWKKAALRVKNVTDRYGIDFPAMPEVGIDGKETPLTQEDLLIVSF